MNNQSWTKGIKAKLIGLALLPVSILIIQSTIAYNGIKQFARENERANEIRIPKNEQLGEMDSARNGLIRWIWATHAEPIHNVEARNSILEKAEFEFQRYKNAAAKYITYDRNEEEKKTYAVVEKNWPLLESGYLEMVKNLKMNSEQGNRRVQEIISQQLRSPLAAMAEAYKNLREQQEARIKIAIIKGDELEKNIVLMTVGCSVAGIILSLFFSILIATRMASNLSQISEKISNASHHVKTASLQLSTASQQLSSGATESASSLEETVSSLEELSSMVKLNTDHAKEAANLSQEGREAAELGDKEMKDLSLAMDDISGSSKKIEEIISVIDDIAFQTNILALNAAVEAARAGEQGKGFAVVAEAVRNLAQQSASAAKQISTLIKDSVQKIENGSQITQKSNVALNKIVNSIKKISDLNKEIASASQEQSFGLSQISKAMNQLDQASQGNAASSEEVAASAEEMSNQSNSMTDLVGELYAVIYGDHSHNSESSIKDSFQSKRDMKQNSKTQFNSNSAILKFTSKKGKLISKNDAGIKNPSHSHNDGHDNSESAA